MRDRAQSKRLCKVAESCPVEPTNSAVLTSIQSMSQPSALGGSTMMLRKFQSLSLVLILCGAAVAADTLTLKDGTAHTGTVISITSRTVSFKEAGTLHRYPRSSVESLQFGGSPAATSAKTA